MREGEGCVGREMMVSEASGSREVCERCKSSDEGGWVVVDDEEERLAR